MHDRCIRLGGGKRRQIVGVAHLSLPSPVHTAHTETPSTDLAHPSPRSPSLARVSSYFRSFSSQAERPSTGFIRPRPSTLSLFLAHRSVSCNRLVGARLLDRPIPVNPISQTIDPPASPRSASLNQPPIRRHTHAPARPRLTQSPATDSASPATRPHPHPLSNQSAPDFLSLPASLPSASASSTEPSHLAPSPLPPGLTRVQAAHCSPSASSSTTLSTSTSSIPFVSSTRSTSSPSARPPNTRGSGM